jgi:hypothetical protein
MSATMITGPRINAYFVTLSCGLFLTYRGENIYSIIKYYTMYGN